ncbi:MAG: hypothetical protein ITG00_05350, partial [Flavobacterium sp.]|nr:hypothetical protein [Flavobacterium sp.]
TTDGVLFASIALYLMSRFPKPTFPQLFIVALFCMLSALTKQSFYPIPLLFTLLIFVRYGLAKSAQFVIATLILIAFYFFFITQITSWERYTDYTTGETHLAGLLYVGVYEYMLFFLKCYTAVPILVLAAFLTFRQRNQFQLHSVFVRNLAVVIMLAAIIACFCNQILIASKIAFVSVALLIGNALLFQKQSLTYISPAIVALGIAWSASISFGYSFPIFYSSGIIAAFIPLGYHHFKEIVSPKIISGAAIIIGIIAFGNSYRPYREKPIPELTHSMAEISPKLKYTKTHRANFDKHSELKNLVSEYGPDFIVAPAIPMANYLFNQQSNLPADWIINTEVNRQYDLFVNLAAHENTYVFLEKSYLQGEEMSQADKRVTSEISWQIHTRFKKISETEHFIIYNGLK